MGIFFTFSVIPAQAGIHHFRISDGFPLEFTLTKVGAGMTEGVFLQSQYYAFIE